MKHMPRIYTPSRPYRLFSMFAGGGGNAIGFKRAGWKSAGAIDSDFEGVPATANYRYFLGGDWPITKADISKLEPMDLVRIASHRPDCVFLSPPCKGFSRCLPKKYRDSAIYQAMNSLTEYGIFLVLEAWAARGKPVPIIAIENVPNAMKEGREWLDRVKAMLGAYGYAVNESKHNCGVLGNLAQSRERMLLVARHTSLVPEFVYKPPEYDLRPVSDELGKLPCPYPGQKEGGPMHRLQKLSAMNWLRLAIIRAGKDWRDLPPAVGIAMRDGRQNGGYGVNNPDVAGHTVVAHMDTANTWGSYADTRVAPSRGATRGVLRWDDTVGTILAHGDWDNGAFSVADPRSTSSRRHGSVGVLPWSRHSTCISAHGAIENHTYATTDPRLQHRDSRFNGPYNLTQWDQHNRTVMASAGIQTGAGAAVQDARLNWAQATHRIVADASAYQAPHTKDPRIHVTGPMAGFEDIKRRLETNHRGPVHWVIMAADGTWHRPFTDLELMALQSFPTKVRGKWATMIGTRKQRRMVIGNAVPPDAAKAMATAFGTALDAALDSNITLSFTPVWVEPHRPAGMAA